MALFAVAASNEYLWHLLQTSCQGEIRFIATSPIWEKEKEWEILWGSVTAICIWYFRSRTDYRRHQPRKRVVRASRGPLPFIHYSVLRLPHGTSFHESAEKMKRGEMTKERKREREEDRLVGSVYIEVFRWLVTRLWWKHRQRKSLW